MRARGADEAARIERTAAAIGLGSVFLAALRSIRDPDFWWHLKTGELIVTSGHLPSRDPFSFMTGGATWIPYSWLVEVLFQACRAAAGFYAFPLLTAGAAAAIVALTWRSCGLAGGRFIVRAVAGLCTALLTCPVWTARPQLVSFVSLAATVSIIEQHRRRGAAPLWILPPLAVLWANSHIYFPLESFLLGLYILGRLAPYRRTISTLVAALRSNASLLLTLVATLLASLVNPWGVKLWGVILGYASAEQMYRVITEVASPNFHDPRGVLFGAYSLTLWCLLAVSRRRVTAEEVTITAAFCAMGLYMWRLVPFFPITTAPILARHLEARLPAHSPPRRRALLASAVAGLCLIAVFLGRETIGWRFPFGAGWRDHVQPDTFPIGAVAYLQSHRAGTRLFNHFNWGGFAIFHLWPRYRVSIDGRTNVYGDERFGDYVRTHFVTSGWEKYFERARPDAILWPRNEAFAQMVRRLPQWRVAYEDEQAVIFVRAEPRPEETRLAEGSGGRR